MDNALQLELAYLLRRLYRDSGRRLFACLLVTVHSYDVYVGELTYVNTFCAFLWGYFISDANSMNSCIIYNRIEYT